MTSHRRPSATATPIGSGVRLRRRSLLGLSALLLSVLPAGIAVAEPVAGSGGTWVSAWSAAPQGPSTLADLGTENFSGTVQAKAVQGLLPPPTTFSNQTIRQVMYLHHGGTALRIRLSNEFGSKATSFPSVTVGRRAGTSGAVVQPDSLRTVTFGGRTRVSIPAGGTALSDVVALPVKAFDHLVLSIFVPAGNGPATVHGGYTQTFFTADGDQTGQAAGSFAEHGIVANRFSAAFTTAEYYATSIQVQGARGDKTLVAFGDSITDGLFSEGNTDTRYPDALARRLMADPATRNLSVVDEAISGNRLTADGFGPSGLSRLDSQLFAHPNLGGVILMEGNNDLGSPALQGLPRVADDLIAAYKEVSRRVHAKGVPVYLGTLTPIGDLLRPIPYGVYSMPAVVAERHQVNQWIRTEGRRFFDGIIDFDAAVKSPLDPDQIDLQYDAADDLHMNSLGYQRMADSIPQAFLDRLSGRE